MPTEEWFKANPKVSGYISQTLHEKLKHFATERSSSISQALTVVLAEYFGVNQQVDQNCVGGVTLPQIYSLEQKLADLTESVDHRFQELEAVIKFFEPLTGLLANQKDLPIKVSSNSLISELLVGLKSDSRSTDDVPILKINPASELDKVAVLNRLPSAPPSGVPIENISSGSHLEQQDTVTVPFNKPLSELLSIEEPEKSLEEKPTLGIQPLSAKQLAERLKVNPSVVNKYKRGARKQSLTDWSRTQDPDEVAWEYSEEQKKYLPIKISSESNLGLQGELLKPSEVELK